MDDRQRPLRLLLRLNAPVSYATALLTVLMMLSVVYDVVARLVFQAPTLWVIDVNEYMLVYLTFLPAAWILLRDNHVKVELVVDRLSPRARRVMAIFGDLMGLAYCAVLTWQSWLVTAEAYRAGYRFSTALAFLQYPVYAIIPVGAAWLGLAFLVRLWVRARGGAVVAPGD
jgi:TRAP-type C4-dicarboxylate transport system permease small subunit